MSSKGEKPRRKVIVVTDGDQIARQALELVARRVGGRVISRSAGNPSPMDGQQLLHLIKKAAYDPVLVMFDDNGDSDQSVGEQALRYIAKHPSVEVIGALAVASKTTWVEGVVVDMSVDRAGHVFLGSVDKNGYHIPNNSLGQPVIYGDTVDVLNELQIPLIVGIGDIGKMHGKDSLHLGAPITYRAVAEILNRNHLPVPVPHPTLQDEPSN